MSECITCDSNQLSSICAKCSDLCFVVDNDSNYEHDGYVPMERAIGGGDYVELTFCRACGQIQNKFPIPPLVEKDDEELK